MTPNIKHVNTVTKVSIETCAPVVNDDWRRRNQSGYFIVEGKWIEENRAPWAELLELPVCLKCERHDKYILERINKLEST